MSQREMNNDMYHRMGGKQGLFRRLIISNREEYHGPSHGPICSCYLCEHQRDKLEYQRIYSLPPDERRKRYPNVPDIDNTPTMW